MKSIHLFLASTRRFAAWSGVVAALWIMAGDVLAATVTGSWDTTALTRIAIKQLGYSTPPQNSADIADGTYVFEAGGNFTAGDIQGTWGQNKAKYTVRPYSDVLSSTYRSLLVSNGVQVNDVRVLSSKVSGLQLEKPVDQTVDYSLWGDESYVYRLDIGSGNTRQILKVTMTVRVAGYPTPATPPAGLSAAQPAPKRPSPLELAAAAVRQFHENAGVASP